METIRRGEFDEPYCSDTCYENAGQRITEGLFSHASGHCFFCRCAVSVSPLVLPVKLIAHKSPVKLIPYRNAFLFFCPECKQQGRELFHFEKNEDSVNECCLCGKKLYNLPSGKSNPIDVCTRCNGLFKSSRWTCPSCRRIQDKAIFFISLISWIAFFYFLSMFDMSSKLNGGITIFFGLVFSVCLAKFMSIRAIRDSAFSDKLSNTSKTLATSRKDMSFKENFQTIIFIVMAISTFIGLPFALLFILDTFLTTDEIWLVFLISIGLLILVLVVLGIRKEDAIRERTLRYNLSNTSDDAHPAAIPQKQGVGCVSCGAIVSFRCSRCNKEYCEKCIVIFGEKAARILIERTYGSRGGINAGTAKIFDDQGRAFCPNCYGNLLERATKTGQWVVQSEAELEPSCIPTHQKSKSARSLGH